MTLIHVRTEPPNNEDAMLEVPHLRISRHAVEQYRSRVVLCCERERSDAVLRKAIDGQVRHARWRCAGGETFVVECGPLVPKLKKPGHYKLASIAYTFVIESQAVVTVLGYLMRPNDRKRQRRRRRNRINALDRASAIME